MTFLVENIPGTSAVAIAGQLQAFIYVLQKLDHNTALSQLNELAAKLVHEATAADADRTKLDPYLGGIK